MMTGPLEVGEQHDGNEVPDREAVGGRIESDVSTTRFRREMVAE